MTLWFAVSTARAGPVRQSPLPMRNGLPPPASDRSSPPPRMMGRRGQSPTGSLHDEIRHPSRPDRPPSIQSHPERRPPSQGPFGPPDVIGGPPPFPGQFGHQAGDGMPPPFPRAGPPPLRDGPPPTLRDGPPPVRDIYAPGRDVPPFYRDGPPPRPRRPGISQCSSCSCISQRRRDCLLRIV